MLLLPMWLIDFYLLGDEQAWRDCDTMVHIWYSCHFVDLGIYALEQRILMHTWNM